MHCRQGEPPEHDAFDPYQGDEKVLEEAEEIYERDKTKNDPDHPSLEYVELSKIKSCHEKLKGIISTFKLSD